MYVYVYGRVLVPCAHRRDQTGSQAGRWKERERERERQRGNPHHTAKAETARYVGVIGIGGRR
jgi:hypothetical protein